MLGCIFSNLLRRTVGTDPDDLWDFGTARHIMRPGMIGQANARTEDRLTYPQPVSDLNNNHMPHHNNGIQPASASKSSLSTMLTVTTKAKLPCPPAHPPAYQEQDQATVHTSRRECEGSYDSNQLSTHISVDRPHFFWAAPISSGPPPFLPGHPHFFRDTPISSGPPSYRTHGPCVPRPGHAPWLSPMCPAFTHCTCACQCLALSSQSGSYV